MLVIGAINILIGLHSYKPPENPGRYELPALHQDAGDTIGNSELPAEVMRAFAVKYPRTIPAGARMTSGPDGAKYFVVTFAPGAEHKHATFAPDGGFVSED